MKASSVRVLLPATIVVALVVLVLSGCGGSTGSTPSSVASTSAIGAATNVTIQDFAFAPQVLTVQAGTKVTWTNEDSAVHTVVSTDSMSTDAAQTDMFSSGNLAQGQAFSFTFADVGTYYYECSIHAGEPAMHGEIVVSGTAPASDSPSSAGSTESGGSSGETGGY